MHYFYYLFFNVNLINCFLKNTNINRYTLKYNKNNDPLSNNPFGRKYYEQRIKNKNENEKNETNLNNYSNSIKKYPLSKLYYEDQIKRLNSKNTNTQNESILNLYNSNETTYIPTVKIILNKSNFLQSLGIKMDNDNDYDIDNDSELDNELENNLRKMFYNQNNKDDYDDDDYKNKKNQKSKHFEVIKNYNILFKDVGGYENVKDELRQCIDILKNYEKYAKYNVRIPKGLILEGPPGTGKTLLSKALAGESKCGFIAVSGSDFQEKYVGVGSSRIKELFELAQKNVPCIIFIDEIDALGRTRSSDGESSSSERDNTLNALLVELDGFKNNTGVFVVSATNRIDLLDKALIRPGRIDKKIYIGLPDSATRKSIIDIHIKGKPYDNSIIVSDMIDTTDGLSGAQIENLLNEAMLNALKYNKTEFNLNDFELVLSKMMTGWQPNEHKFTENMIDHIAIHEMGHAVVGLFSKHHSKVSKVVINLYSPQSPGYTIFKGSNQNIHIREALFEHLMILLGGRIAEEVFYNVSVTTGAINDFEEALKLAQKMILYYGMGTNIIYPSLSEKYKELIDTEVINLINEAYQCSEMIILNSKSLIYETAEILKKDKLIKSEFLYELVETKYSYLKNLKIEFE